MLSTCRNLFWGDYLEFRKTVQRHPDITAITEDELFTLALTQEFCFNLRPATQLAIKWYFGKVYQGQLRSPESSGDPSINFMCLNVHYSYHRLMVLFQLSQYENFGANIWVWVSPPLTLGLKKKILSAFIPQCCKIRDNRLYRKAKDIFYFF